MENAKSLKSVRLFCQVNKTNGNHQSTLSQLLALSSKFVFVAAKQQTDKNRFQVEKLKTKLFGGSTLLTFSFAMVDIFYIINDVIRCGLLYNHQLMKNLTNHFQSYHTKC